MSDTMPGSTEWVQVYEQNIHGQAASSLGFIHGQATSTYGFSNAPVFATSGAPDGTSPSSSIIAASGQSASQGCASKPSRRRSRVSKRTPTTLLTANAGNFRALVQQFTGCPRTANLCGSPKGPINLNFQVGSAQNHCHEATIMRPFGNSYYHQQSQMQLPEQPQQRHHQQLHQTQQCTVSPGNITSDYYSPMSTDPRPSLEMPNGFVMDDTSVHGLPVESFSNEIMNDGYF